MVCSLPSAANECTKYTQTGSGTPANRALSARRSSTFHCIWGRLTPSGSRRTMPGRTPSPGTSGVTYETGIGGEPGVGPHPFERLLRRPQVADAVVEDGDQCHDWPSLRGRCRPARTGCRDVPAHDRPRLTFPAEHRHG